jgi:cytochrome c2
MRKKGIVITVALLVVAGWLGLSANSTASMDIQKQAKAAGVDAKCQTCHTVAMPKKGSGPDELNDCGKWLVSQKEAKKAAAVDGAWAKDCPKK